MKVRGLSSDKIEFRSIEEQQLEKIHKYQNGELRQELSEFLEFNFPWAPMSMNQIKAKIDEFLKEDRNLLFGIWSKENEFIGLAYYIASWDTWSPFFSVIIWPEYRRKGYGSEATRLILEAAFNQSIGHAVSALVPEWNLAGIAFLESQGFKRAGTQRRTGVIDGKFYDGFFFDILRDEYLSRHSRGVDF